ncbi:hypothetical protein GCM10010174_15160 [Kutzneria viridogrisea]|uniref:Secreted protein n=2 Tax=Kutzneria TaxID=43356 RepID=W5WI38_9PSEU|nr:hypothetical protein [Kutzneria albida]AHI00859.1 hypothetical protein KALB_7501 [Kutzneria albida DSM 43870]MBA8926136.1 hypothetical protein [Kutzneria viridogrisea]
MLKKLLVCVPIVAVLAATGLSASASATPAPAAVAATAKADCTKDTPEVKALLTSLDGLKAALLPEPNADKVRDATGDVIMKVMALQKAGCLPPLPGTAVKADPSACLNAVVNAMSSLFGVLAAAIKTPPDPAAITTAMAALGKAITAINTAKCLPFDLPVPGGGTPPIPAPPGGLPPIPGT